MIKEKKLLPLFLSESLRSVAVSLLSFFSAIFIFKKTLAITDNEKQAFLAVFSFFTILYLFKLISTSLAENLALKSGLKTQIFLGHFLTALSLVAFAGAEKNFVFLWLAAVFWGLAIGFFWFGRHGLLTKIGEKGRFGQAIGWAGIMNTILLLGVPFLGGVLVSQFGYQALFLAAFVFVLLAFLALIPVGEQKTHRDVTLKEILKIILSHKRMTLAYFATGVVGTFYSTALILYIFHFLEKELAFGGFFSLSMLLVALVNFVVGRWVDKRGKRSLVAYGSVFTSLVWLGRFMANTVGVFLVLDVFDRIAGGMLGIPLAVLSFEKALDGRSTGRALLFREATITIGSIFACLLLIGLVLLGLELKFAFLLPMVFSLLPLLIVKKQSLYGE